jgi:Ni/Co efflux regulator RcnB
LRQPSYRFRTEDRAHLRRYYQAPLGTVRVERRPHFSVGYAIPRAYRSHITVMPQHVRRHLPPPPRGYQVGYYQGYSVVYDPVTFTILSVLDLLTH